VGGALCRRRPASRGSAFLELVGSKLRQGFWVFRFQVCTSLEDFAMLDGQGANMRVGYPGSSGLEDYREVVEREVYGCGFWVSRVANEVVWGMLGRASRSTDLLSLNSKFRNSKFLLAAEVSSVNLDLCGAPLEWFHCYAMPNQDALCADVHVNLGTEPSK
jgi:hypothetical protein